MGQRPRRKGGFRHLIYFIDGTWLWPGSDRTLDVYSNVYLLNTLLQADDGMGHAQIVHYARGLGAVSGVRRYTAGGFAYGIDELVADLYINICSNYEPGDKLYLFGFSRGAVVARALTGLISRGILEAHHINWFAHVWAKFVGSGQVTLPGLPASLRSRETAQLDFADKCSEPNPPIEFVGVFDTVVGGHGLTAVAQRLRLGDRKVPRNVKHGVHLISIDETRNFFEPVFWTGVEDNPSPPDPARPPFPWVPSVEQIWLPGVHSDIGGAFKDRILGNLALQTMIDRVIARTDLEFDMSICKTFGAKPQGGSLVKINNEFTNRWRVFCPIPKARRIKDTLPSSIHPYAKHLSGRVVDYKEKGSSVAYELPAFFEKLDVAPEFLTTEFETNI